MDQPPAGAPRQNQASESSNPLGLAQDSRDMGLAMLLVERGIITSLQLQRALELLTASPGRPFEEILLKHGLVIAEQLAAANAVLGRGSSDLVPGYAIIEKIGHGGMGAVYRARQLSLDRIVAIKVLLPRVAHDRGMVDRFLIEIRAIAHLAHPNLVAGIDAGFHHGLYYYVMEFIEGRTLTRELNIRSPLQWREALQITRQIAGALAHAHGRDFIHCDVKPDNIIIDATGTAKLMDLGLTRLEGVSSEKDEIAGTPLYMSPEQAAGRKDLDHRTDLYSLGLTLFEMLCGHPAFEVREPKELLARRAREEPSFTLLREANPPEAALRILRKLTARDREKRYWKAEEAIAEIDAAMKGKTVVAPKASRRMTHKPTKSRGSKAPLLIAGALVLLGVAIGSLLMKSNSEKTTAPAARTPLKPPADTTVLPLPPSPPPPPAKPPSQPLPVPVPAATDESWQRALKYERDWGDSNPDMVLFNFIEARDGLRSSEEADRKIGEWRKRLEERIKLERVRLEGLIETGNPAEAAKELAAATRRFSIESIRNSGEMPGYTAWPKSIQEMEGKLLSRVEAEAQPLWSGAKGLEEEGKVQAAIAVYEKLKTYGVESVVRRAQAEIDRIAGEKEQKELAAATDDWNVGMGWKAAKELALVKDYDGAVQKLQAVRAGIQTQRYVGSIEELIRDMEAVQSKAANPKAKLLRFLFEGNLQAAERALLDIKEPLRKEYADLLDRVREQRR